MHGSRWRSAAVVAAMVLIAGACADDGDDSISAPSTTTEALAEETTTSTAPSTTVADATTTTEAAPTTTSSTTTTVTETTEPRELPYWTDECTELTGDANASYVSDAALGAFTTLGAEPSLDLLIPEVITSVGPYGSIAASAVIPGGLAVGVYPPDGWPVSGDRLVSSSMVAVDHGGGIRWRRCFDVEARSFVVAPPALEPATAWVPTVGWDEPFQILGVDLATGEDVRFPVDVSELQVRGWGSRFIVLGVRHDAAAITDADRLVVVDLLDATTSEIPYPGLAIGRPPVDTWFTVHDVDPLDDDVVLVLGSLWPGDAQSVFVDGAWTEEAEVWRDVLPAQVTETFGEPFELRLLDGAGDAIWAIPDFHSMPREGFHWAVADDVVVALRCTEWGADGYCGWVEDQPPQEELVAYDIDTGREVWRAPGGRGFPVIVGNEAIVSVSAGEFGADTDGYVLIDLLTGERIGPDGDAWPAGSFAQECCGGDVYVNVRQSGAVVVATNMEHVRVWYPPELTTPTVTVDLMG